MRKLIPCLLVAGTALISACNQHGASAPGGGPGVVASDDPLTYVPAETPYVFANIDPVPADVSGPWMDIVDKSGKVGDMYAADIDFIEKNLREQASGCTPAASGGGGGSALQDPASNAGGADSTAASTGDAAAADASAPPAGAPAANTSAAPDAANVAAAAPEDKCSPDETATRNLELKLLDAVKAETAGKDLKQLMDLAGVVPQTHAALYGIGLVPVFRIELDKPDNLRATIARLETTAGTKLKTGKIGTQDYWIVGDDTANAKLDIVFAIAGKQLVATLAPAKPNDADLRTLFGLDKPAKSLAEDGGLAAFNKKMNYQSYGSGYFDTTKLVALLKAQPTPLETSFMTAMGGHWQTIDPVCSGEYDQLAAAWPRVSFGYSELAAKHVAVRGVLETRADIAQDLMTLRAPMPGLAASQDSLVDFGFSANLTKLPDLATKYADATAKTPWKCSALTSLNQSADQTKTSLTNPMFAGTMPLFHGFHAIVDKLDLKDDQPIPDFAMVVAVGSDNPAALLPMIARVLPGIDTLGLKPDGVAKPVPANPNLPVTAPVSAAITDKVLALSVGTGEDAKLAGAMKSDDAQQPLFEMGGKGDLYHILAQYQRKGAQSNSDPAAQKMIQQQAAMMDAYANMIQRFDIRVELTAQGIEMHETVDTK